MTVATQIGYYKWKVSDLTAGEVREIKFYRNGNATPIKTCTVYGLKYCNDFKLLKYIDKNGQYRFQPFNDKWLQSDNSTSLGDKRNFVTSLIDGQGSIRSLGYENDRVISLTAEDVDIQQLDKLSDIYTSPVVLLYVGDGTTDLQSDWVLVKVSGDGVGRRRKLTTSKVNIQITLPEYYAITQIQ